MILVDAEDVAMSRPGKPLFDGLSVTVASGDRLGVVGVNGSGKSTLLGVLAGTVEPEAGAVRRGRGARVTFLDQAAPLPPGTVREVVSRLRAEAAGTPSAAAVAAASGPTLDHRAAAILDRLGMSQLLDADVSSLSGGEAKRVALALALVAVDVHGSTESDLLILDEPTNHLDIDAIAWLEDWLSRFRGGLALVTHDRHVLDRLTTRMLELEGGRAYVHDGGYASYLDAKAERREREQAAEQVRRNLARAELAWLRRGARARTRKPKADVAAALKVVNGRPVEPERSDELPLHVLTQTPRLGNTVVELHGVGDGYEPGDDHLLFQDLDLVLDRQARLGVVGPNGTGKSTLLDVIAGRRAPRHGEVVRGQTVRIGYYDQRGVDLPLDSRVREVVAGPARQPDWSDAALLERFWFATDTQWAPVRLLSGGERRRLQLVLTLRQGPNVLLLDEPTNDLDLDTLRALEELLDTWAGALVVVSHDRTFLERTVDEVLVMDGRGHAARMPGGFAAYEALLRERGGRSSSGAGRAGHRGGADRTGGVDGDRPGRTAAAAPKDGAARGGTGAPGSPGDRGGGPAGQRVGAEAPGGGRARSRGRTASTLRHLLRQAQTAMTRLQKRQAELEAELAGAGTDPGELARVGQELAEVQTELATAEEEWLTLAEEAESVGLKV